MLVKTGSERSHKKHYKYLENVNFMIYDLWKVFKGINMTSKPVEFTGN